MIKAIIFDLDGTLIQTEILKAKSYAMVINVLIKLDVPSGIDAETGKRAVNHINPSATLTLALPKTGLFPEVSGELYVADIGIPPEVYNKIDISYKSPFGKDFYKKIEVA